MEKRYGYKYVTLSPFVGILEYTKSDKTRAAEAIAEQIDDDMRNWVNIDHRNPQFWLNRGPGICATFVQLYTGAPKTEYWRKGSKVFQNENVQPGTAIATFDWKGHYPGVAKKYHAAIYLHQDDTGIYVYQQCSGNRADLTKSWKNFKYPVSKIDTGALPTRGKLSCDPKTQPADIGILDARKYFVVTDMSPLEKACISLWDTHITKIKVEDKIKLEMCQNVISNLSRPKNIRKKR